MNEDPYLIVPMCRSGIHRGTGMAEMLKRYFNTEVVHLSQGRFWKSKCHGKMKGQCGVCKFSHMHSENDAEFRKLMMQCNATSLKANDDPDWTRRKKPFAPEQVLIAHRAVEGSLRDLSLIHI